MQKFATYVLIIGLTLMSASYSFAQLSPGDLAEVHAHLEGLSNCTKCHTIGEKVSNQKCLDCHELLNERISAGKGLHSIAAYKSRQCYECHNDHHGRKFQIIRFDKDTFNHQLTGYVLEGKHAQSACDDCHNKEFIQDKRILEKKYTYLGLIPSCVTCHEDVHRNTLSSSNCVDCHNFEAFKPAQGFNHSNANYKLTGKHLEVECEACHPIVADNQGSFQKFTGLAYGNCSDCHEDVHNGKFGPNCMECHSEVGFAVIKKMNDFDHSLTRYPLEGKHQYVDCKSCHPNRYTDPLAFNRCTDCHEDFHDQQFNRPDYIPDCIDCHDVNGFNETSYTIERHQQSQFELRGAHIATPCFVCHQKEERWEFRNIGRECYECHEDIHADHIQEKFYPAKSCLSCHNEERWQSITFDHLKTNFELTGAHLDIGCSDCHFPAEDGVRKQVFRNLSINCADCHEDIHYNQFEKEGRVSCNRCHETVNWQASLFDHNTARFQLDGEHTKVNCDQCHPQVNEGGRTYIKYITNQLSCEDCH